MPGEKRRIDPGVIHRLRDEPYRFEFFQAVRLLLGWHRSDSVKRDRDLLGHVIRFRSSVSLAFPPSEIEALVFETPRGQEQGDAAGSHAAAVTLTPSFIGLTGPLGVMPRHYTQQVAEREIYHRDTATRAFLDIFSTRAIAVFYQTWLKCRLHLQYESDRENHFLPMLLSLAGLGLSGTTERLKGDSAHVADESLAYYASALRERPQSAQWFSRVVPDRPVHRSVVSVAGTGADAPGKRELRIGANQLVRLSRMGSADKSALDPGTDAQKPIR